MKTVWKFPLSPGNQKLSIPDGAELIHVESQRGQPCLWAVVDTRAPLVERSIVIVGAGHDLPDGELRHIGSFLLVGGALDYHVFEAKP